ncbi:hypothetical protein DPEC_G00254150 [Dallia pectoralis]|uniref:Uncharacterized protein n=1 Tax=Dallia pectoralis TaxID=75939 RepID=A0ACC2FUH9_DALPE|nr:hypothetical protein DPEC_G00254150 [Dallia pectoralis]
MQSLNGSEQPTGALTGWHGPIPSSVSGGIFGSAQHLHLHSITVTPSLMGVTSSTLHNLGIQHISAGVYGSNCASAAGTWAAVRSPRPAGKSTGAGTCRVTSGSPVPYAAHSVRPERRSERAPSCGGLGNTASFGTPAQSGAECGWRLVSGGCLTSFPRLICLPPVVKREYHCVQITRLRLQGDPTSPPTLLN